MNGWQGLIVCSDYYANRIQAVLPLGLLFIGLTQTGLGLWILPTIAAYFQVEGTRTENRRALADHLSFSHSSEEQNLGEIEIEIQIQ